MLRGFGHDTYDTYDNDVVIRLNQKVPDLPSNQPRMLQFAKLQKVSFPALFCSSLELQEDRNCYLMPEAPKPPVPIGGLITS